MPLKNAARIPKTFQEFQSLLFEKSRIFPLLKRGEDIVISIRIGTNGLREKALGINTAKNI